MKNLTLSLFVVITLLFSCKNSSQSNDQSTTVEVVKPVDFNAKVENNTVQLIDVRTPKEYDAGHLKSSKNINVFDKNFMTQMETLDKTKPVYVYCKSGKRSANASSKLKAAGFTKIYDLQGGFVAWSKENLEIEK
ncbi:rhodanese-like domain-containing protein [Aureibaculum algae]|uniref:Rhodanese-like domain-containing protein n=1 Tax=Aureibaculum algae TaxID=2584122 RepID=A0A5B7TLM9_9FLAO|nr:rhodanese-like domain-containing protein [Aureibaculum algae]QCX37040.1 rhodanese-like domain-containing protein [Aureibaculum algae]